ncbi:hypothetical protein ACP4OV_009290 [Aristida adscensionis]
MARGYETLGAASSSGSYATVAAHELRRQRSTPAAGVGVGAVARALWAWIVRGRRKKAASRSGSVKGQYGHEDYADNFDEGAAAAEPENLSRSFSARYAARRRHDGPAAPWDGGARR